VAREVWITGTGLLTALGEGEDATWAALDDPARWRAAIDSESFKPFHVHSIRALDLDRHIPRKGDQRQMGALQQYGAYAAGMALADAGIAGQPELLKTVHLVVASTGGERDETLDGQIVATLTDKVDRDVQLNEQLATGLRPTLFLAQLPNLFGGNISIVHGVAGSSRTFMGEEPAGVDALRIAFERIAADQGDCFLVGSAYNGARRDAMLVYQPAGLMLSGPMLPLWKRPRGGIAFGSMGTFLVAESRAHAEARGAKPLARLSAVMNDRCARAPGEATANARRQWEAIQPQLRAGLGAGPFAVMSGACGAGPITGEEHGFLERLAGAGATLAVRGTAAALGHGFEASFLANVILAISSVRRGRVFAPLDADDPLEAIAASGVTQAIATAWGHWRGEGLALIEAI
jgi:3-oxoacyl-[acyl-carrier-protein] synthase II